MLRRSDSVADIARPISKGRVGYSRAYAESFNTIYGAPSGQTHHPISRPIHKALEEHPNLQGQYRPRDPRLATQAADQAAHSGWQTWHRELDAEVAEWVRHPANANKAPADFEAWLRLRYSQPDLKARFPKGF
jgi:hypothetical protein